jgi:hypothetical protein
MAVVGSKANGKLARSVIRGQARRLRGFMKRRRREEEKKGTQRCKGARTQREEGEREAGEWEEGEWEEGEWEEGNGKRGNGKRGIGRESLKSIRDLAVGFGGS